MTAINLKPEKMFEEMVNFNQKLTEGIKNLKEMGPISTGVTPKEVVYTEDKLQLQHFIPAEVEVCLLCKQLL